MIQKARLLKLAAVLENVDKEKYDISNPDRDALYYASHIPEFKKLGLKYLRGVVRYKDATEFDAAMQFFGIDTLEAQHLFGTYEQDEFGYRSASPFSGMPFRGLVKDKLGKRIGGEPPQYTATRIKSFITNYEAIRGVKDKVVA